MHVRSRYCVARVPDSTCHVTRVCYKAGLTKSFCEAGLCMCKWGYHLGWDGKCRKGEWANPWTLSAAVGNFSQADLQEMMTYQDAAVSLNILMFTAWVAAAVTFGSVLMVFAWRKVRAGTSEEDTYKALAGNAEPFLET